MKIPLKLPGWFQLFLGAGLATGILGAVGYLQDCNSLGQAMSLIVLTLTLMAVAGYTYLQYLIVYDLYAPTANFTMKQDPGDPYHILTFFRNDAKHSIQVLAELKATVYGKVIDIGGFYSKQHPWDLLPHTQGQGHFHIRDILKKTEFTIESMTKAANQKPDELKNQLRFSGKTWYKSLQIPIEVEAPVQNYYFDFSRDVLVLDV